MKQCICNQLTDMAKGKNDEARAWVESTSEIY